MSISLPRNKQNEKKTLERRMRKINDKKNNLYSKLETVRSIGGK
jgi:hypothetical protein